MQNTKTKEISLIMDTIVGGLSFKIDQVVQIWFYMCFSKLNFLENFIGKPFGWITSSEGRDAGVNFTHIAFPILLVAGKVSITYLSSYENSGVMEVWVRVRMLYSCDISFM